MSKLNHSVGLNHVPSYQVSMRPFVQTDIAVLPVVPVSIEFEYITGFITIKNDHDEAGLPSPLRVGFSETGIVGTNYFVLENGEAYTGKWKLKNIWLMAHTAAIPSPVVIIAGLTNIASNKLKGNSGYDGHPGVG